MSRAFPWVELSQISSKSDHLFEHENVTNRVCMYTHKQAQKVVSWAYLCVLIDFKQQRGRVGVVAQADPVPAVVERLLGEPDLAVRLRGPRPRHQHLLEQRRHVQRVALEPLREQLAT